MPRTSPEGLKRANRTADKYVNRSGGTPSPQVYGRNYEGFELAKHKLKIRKQRDEIEKLKRSIRTLRNKLKSYVD